MLRSVHRNPRPPLELATFEVRDVVFGDHTRLIDGVLTINRDELKAHLMETGDFRDIVIDAVKPGDDVRLVHILDLVEPRLRVSEPGTDFPGWLSPPRTVGSGRTNRLGGLAVLEVAEPVPGEPTYWREAILDMGGEGAKYSPFSQLVNLVIDFKPRSERFASAESMENVIAGTAEANDFGRAVRMAGLKASVYLAKASVGNEPDRVELYDLARPVRDLPKVVYLFQGGPYVYGEVIPSGGGGGAPTALPTVIHPSEILDGALVNAFAWAASARESTYSLQNHAVVEELYRRNGHDLNFAGVVLFTNGDSVRTKTRISNYAANLAVFLGAEGAVINYLGGGHPIVDVMWTCQALEKKGVKTTLLLMEMAANPEDSGHVHYVVEANAITSTGNYEQTVHLGQVSRVIGGTTILETGKPAGGELDLTLRHMLDSTHQFGRSHLRGRTR